MARRLTRPDVTRKDLWRLPRAYQDFYNKYMFDSAPRMEALQSTFMTILLEAKATYIVIDALDECPQHDDRSEILQFLARVSRSAAMQTHILLTSRSEQDIIFTLSKLSLPALTKLAIQDPQIDVDVKKHVQRWIENESPHNQWSPEIENLIVSQLTSRCHGVFKWVECQLITLEVKRRHYDVEEALKQLPKDLDETYARMLAQIEKKGYAKEARSIFQWLAFSRRTLTVAEVAEAAVFTIQDIPALTETLWPVPFDRMRFRNPNSDIQSILSQLVTVSEEGHISFAHFSVLEYLLCNRVNAIFSVQESIADRFILESCLLYISHFASEFLDVAQTNPRKGYPLMQYACQFWHDHAKNTFANKAHTSHTDKLVFKIFLNNGAAYLASLKISSIIPGTKRRFLHDNGSHASPAWFMSYHNLDHGLELVSDGLAGAMDPGFNCNFEGCTALHIAAKYGHHNVAVILLTKGADIEARDDENGGTSLHTAAVSGNEDIVELLLAKGSNLNSKDFYGQTALHRAAIRGYNAVIDQLVERKLHGFLDSRDIYGYTALHSSVRGALWRGEEGHSTVKKLLEAGSDPQIQSLSGARAVDEAAIYDNSSLVELMVSYGTTAPVGVVPFLHISFRPRYESQARRYEDATKYLHVCAKETELKRV